jgi:AcrR family transcriptional regulator
MTGSLPTLFVNVGHVHTYLRDIETHAPIGIVASAAYPPDPILLTGPALSVAIRLLDPLTFQLQLPAGDQTDPFTRLPYRAAGVNPAALSRHPAERTALIDAIAAQSRGWGADLIIAPYFHAVDPDDLSFEATLAMASASVDRFGEDSVLPASFVHQNSLMPQHRHELLNRLTRTDFQKLYLLIGVDTPSTTPISNDEVLSGIRFVMEVLHRNGIEVLWGATDTTGLLATAWAPSTSYALGPETYLRRRRQPTATARPRGGFTPATPRVFSRDLLSELKVPDYGAWTAAGRLGCPCRACVRRGAVDGRVAHYVNNHAELTSAIETATDPPGELGLRIDRAMAQIGTGPSDADARRHLQHWRQQLP